MTGQDGKGAKELFAQHDTRELVRQGERTERQALVGPLKQRGVQTRGATDHERDRFGNLKPAAEPLRKRLTGPGRRCVRCERHNPCAVDDTGDDPLTLHTPRTLDAVLQGLGRDLVDTQRQPLGDTRLVLLGRSLVWWADLAHTHDLHARRGGRLATYCSTVAETIHTGWLGGANCSPGTAKLAMRLMVASDWASVACPKMP